jgi:hypothetical protein
VAGRLPRWWPPTRPSAKAALVALVAVSLLGTADVAEFLATRSSMFANAPSRAAGSVVGLVAWAALLGVATLRYTRGEQRGARAFTLGLAGLVAAGNLGLAAIHLKAGVGGVRPIVGGVLGVLALVLAFASVAPTLALPPRAGEGNGRTGLTPRDSGSRVLLQAIGRCKASGG